MSTETDRYRITLRRSRQRRGREDILHLCRFRRCTEWLRTLIDDYGNIFQWFDAGGKRMLILVGTAFTNERYCYRKESYSYVHT